MRFKLILAGLALALGAGLTLTAHSQMKPEVMVKQRQAAMTLQLKYLGPLFAMAQGKAPFNAETVARNAAYLDVLDRMAWDGFDPSSKDTTATTRALPVIWSEPAKFKEAQTHFQSAVSELVAASKSGDEAKMKAAIGAVGKSCGACHDHFREKR
jgi:cytochrome c556